ncbi:hybrid sensor histidine kinase/response regulator [Acidisoma silvae]|uniref:histidine kinase n=1 Tax=Acidisoma silvae TaxID=2802396 RepID=A0A963YPI2_9PROT|nr:PAS domain-containing sensor histidine kinase [Acidisoma silvae]MCB8874371.1 PAS domain-containing protein [Acidisoma silvae]
MSDISSFPIGGGAMGAMIRSHDWVSSPFGEPRTWSQSLRTAVSLMLDSIGPTWLAWGPDLTLLYNDSYAPMLGGKHPQAFAARLTDVWAEIWPDVGPLVDQALAGKPIMTRDLPLHVDRGAGIELAYFTFSYTPLRDDLGMVAGLFCSVLETTAGVTADQRRDVAAHALQSANRSLEREVAGHVRDQSQLWHVSQDLFCIADRKGKVLSVNPAWSKTLGFGESDLVGRTLEWLEHPDDRDQTRKALRQLLRGRVPQAFENRYRNSSGDYRIFSWTGIRSGERLFCSARDVTEERAREATLSDAQDFARLALAAVGGVGVWTYDAASDQFSYDAAIAEVYGLDPARGPGGIPRTEFLANVHPDDRKALATTMAGGLTRAGDLELEYRLCHPDGSVRWVLSRGHTYHDDQGRPIRRTGVGVETTNQRQMEEVLRQSQKLEAIGQLTGGVAHDFNNLLTVIKTSVDLLKRPNLPEERRGRYVDAIADTADRAARLTSQLLAFARRQALKPEVFSASDGVQAISDMMRTLIGSRVSFVTELPAHGCFVNADPTQFDTALVNIAANARDAMDGDGKITLAVQAVDEKPAIRSHAAVSGAFVAISLSDTGSGIEADKLERIFEPFFTTKEIGKGTGLGLSQVFGFAKQSGGEVTVTSEVGVGTTFTLYLPRVAAPTGKTKSLTQSDGLPSDHNTCVLLVEDNADVGGFATQALVEIGYLPILAVNAEEALMELSKNSKRFHVVFSDVVMPGMSGIELAQEIRRLYPDLPVVLTSGYSHVLAQHGSHGFPLIHKPYSIDHLSRTLAEAVGD